MNNSSPALTLQSNYKSKNSSLDMISVPLPNYLSLLYDDIKIVGFEDILNDCHTRLGATKSFVAKQAGVHFVTYFNYLSGKNRCSLSMLKKLSVIYNEDLLELAFEGNYLFISRKKSIQLPRRLTSELAYFVGYLQGDGCIDSNRKVVDFCDEYKSQAEHLNQLTKELFGIPGVVREVNSSISKKPYYTFSVLSRVVNSFLSSVFEINLGVKKDLRIPLLIRSNPELLKHYISGLFDADGTLPKNPPRVKQLFIDVTFKDKEFIEEIKTVLAEYGVRTLKMYKRVAKSPTSDSISSTWELRIRKQADISKFLREVGFKHPDKSRRAKEVIAMLTKNEPAGN